MNNNNPTYLTHHPATSAYINWHLNKVMKLYEQHGSIIIGVDFDHTVRCPISDNYFKDVVDLVIKAKSRGHIICIWTANQTPEVVKEHLSTIGIDFDYFNDSPLKYDGRKAHFNILLDDTAGLDSAMDTLRQFLKETK